MDANNYDAIIIGGGVIGAAVARYLSAFKGRFLLVESENDVACGASKANSGIVHSGFDAQVNTLKARFNVEGNKMFASLAKELEVPFKINGAMVVSFEGQDELLPLKNRADINGASVEIISGSAARKIEPQLSTEVKAALFAKDSAIVSPYELTIALIENARSNGFEVKANTKIINIKRAGDGFACFDGYNTYHSRAVINCAGIYADVIHNMLCADKISLYARRGEYCLFDKNALNISCTVFQCPNKMGKGILVTPTVHGNLLAGPTAEDIDDKSDTDTTVLKLDDVLSTAKKTLPCINSRDIITQFSGLRSKIKGKDDFIVGESGDFYFEALGIDSPGLASAPAIGKYLCGLIVKKLNLQQNPQFNPHRKAIESFNDADEQKRAELIAQNPAYGKIVCRCENVTEAEIIQAIERGAVDLDGIKRRVRAQMGRCQGGFCTPRLLELLSEHLNIPMHQITKSGGHSYILKNTKERL